MFNCGDEWLRRGMDGYAGKWMLSREIGGQADFPVMPAQLFKAGSYKEMSPILADPYRPRI
jgi:hypothetical protein